MALCCGVWPQRSVAGLAKEFSLEAGRTRLEPPFLSQGFSVIRQRLVCDQLYWQAGARVPRSPPRVVALHAAFGIQRDPRVESAIRALEQVDVPGALLFHGHRL